MLTFFISIYGENYHYGTPTNPCAPARVPGGSSSGSAVAVAAGLVDFSLGEILLLTHVYILFITTILTHLLTFSSAPIIA